MNLNEQFCSFFCLYLIKKNMLPFNRIFSNWIQIRLPFLMIRLSKISVAGWAASRLEENCRHRMAWRHLPDRRDVTLSHFFFQTANRPLRWMALLAPVNEIFDKIRLSITREHSDIAMASAILPPLSIMFSSSSPRNVTLNFALPSNGYWSSAGGKQLDTQANTACFAASSSWHRSPG